MTSTSNEPLALKPGFHMTRVELGPGLKILWICSRRVPYHPFVMKSFSPSMITDVELAVGRRHMETRL
jgi:hypothetical protein